MPKYNTTFELGLRDIKLIEDALRTVDSDVQGKSEEQSAIHDLLGRLHAQKEFYRPNSGVYISG